MKKYLIDQDQMTYLLRILRCYPLIHEELKKLKPIEPLSDPEIKAMSRNHTAEDLCHWSYRMGIDDAARHFMGEKQ